ncbi:MAG: RNA-directed DNA polymerase [Proteobacteria bacterium]|nr:MAG: RNA-directed DNA polymerase [Pseudomonadota bacterium]
MEKKFSTMLRVDVSKCFPSIYTHTISWAVKDIEFGKNNVKAVSFGNEMDRAMQRMNYNETNGIPVGPEFSRLFAEIILQSVDEKVKGKLLTSDIIDGRDYVIRRYVDDFIVFASNRDVIEHVRMAISSCLSDVNLHLNDAKTEFMERPFQTRTSSIAAAALDVLEGFWQQNTVSVEREQLTLSYAAPIKNHGLLAKSLIRSIKTICHNNGSDYGSIASVLTAAIDVRIQRLVDSYDRNAVPKDHLSYQVRLMMALLEVSYFLYGVRPSVSASYKLGRSTVLAIRFVRANFHDMLPQFSEHIVRQCEGFLASATQGWMEEFGVVPIEQINVLVCLTELPSEYLKTMGPLIKKLAERTSDYFSLVNLIFVAGRGGLLPAMAGTLESRARSALSSDLRPDRKAEDLLKLFDLISCPYLSLGIRQELVQLGLAALKMDPINRARREAVVTDFEKNPWFTRWDRIDLLREITRRELNQAY